MKKIKKQKKVKKINKRINDPIWDWPKLAKGKNKPMGLSPDDILIYGE